MSAADYDELRERGLTDQERQVLEEIRDAFLAGYGLAEDHPLRGLFVRTGEAMRQDLIGGMETMDTEVRSYMLRHGLGQDLGGRGRPTGQRRPRR